MKIIKKDIENIKQIMKATTQQLVEKMENVKFRKNIFKKSKLFYKNQIETVVKDWETLEQETKIEWFEKVLFKTKDESGNESNKSYEEILMITELLKKNKLNIVQTFREIKMYGKIKKEK